MGHRRPLDPAQLDRRHAVIGHGAPWALAGSDDATVLAPDWQGTVGPDRDLWGATPPGTAPAAPLQLGYRSELELDGLTWLRNRIYEPATRAFLAPDPLPAVPGTPWSANPYHYAGNNPVGLSDPLGLRPVTDAELARYRDQMASPLQKAGDWSETTGNTSPPARWWSAGSRSWPPASEARSGRR